MKTIEDIFELTDSILPADAKKTVFFCEVEEKAYEIFYYAYLSDGSRRQCYELAEEGRADEAALDAKFEEIARFIRQTDSYEPEKRNVVTLCIEGMNETVNVDHFDKSQGLYKIKKDWKAQLPFGV